MASCRSVSRPRSLPALAAAVVALAAVLSGCGGSGGTAGAPVGQGAGGAPAKRAQGVCLRAMPALGLIDLTDLSPQTEPQLRSAMRSVRRTVDGLRRLGDDPLAKRLAHDLAHSYDLGTSYLRLARGEALGAAANSFEELKDYLAQVQSDAALGHAPSCALHALLD